jgi:hypothetical protein
LSIEKLFIEMTQMVAAANLIDFRAIKHFCLINSVPLCGIHNLAHEDLSEDLRS